jgi:hypothetical protein
LNFRALAIAATILGSIAAGCTVRIGAPHVDLWFSVLNRSSSTAVVTIDGPAHYTLSVHSCSGSGVGLIEGDYTVKVDLPAQHEQSNVHVALQASVPAAQVILIRADGTVDFHSDADPNKKAC